jgi:hypothetical protein
MQSPTRALVVLVALKKNGRSTGELEKEVEELHKIAKAWYRGGRKFEQPVWFAWIDGERYKKWLKQNYGYVSVKKSSTPRRVLKLAYYIASSTRKCLLLFWLIQL